MYLKVRKLDEEVKFNEEKLQAKILRDLGEQKVLVFAIKKNQELPTHISPVDAMIFVIDGKIEFTADGKNYKLEKNNIFEFQKNLEHKVLGLEDSHFLVIRM